VDELHKGFLLIAASILAARKLAQMDDGALLAPAGMCAISDAISRAELILRMIERWPPAQAARKANA
jgi:hypothetical protein